MNKNVLLELQSFLSNMRNSVSQGAYFHYGDLLWRMYFISNEFDESQDIRIWKNGNTIIGFVFILAKENNPEIFIKPEFYNSIESDEMLEYCIETVKNNNGKFIETSCLKSDKIKSDYLSRNNFIIQDDIMVVMEKDILETKDILLPSDYSFIKPEECDKYQNSLNWLTSKQIQRLYDEPNINNCMSSIICYRNNEVVSGSLCWYDQIGNCGSFEPVETSSKHQKKGLAYIGMNRILSELKLKGVRKAYVKTGIDNESAIRLYKKLGFVVIDEDFGWRLEI